MQLSLRKLPRQYQLILASFVVLALLVQALLCWRWSREPDRYLEIANISGQTTVAGRASTSALIGAIDWLLEKPGGYLSNDVYLPSRWLDNMPNFELGILIQARERVSALGAGENSHLAAAADALNRTDRSWLFPRAEGQLADARDALRDYRESMADASTDTPPFDASAASLRLWLAQVERRLGELSEGLAASVGRNGLDSPFAGEPLALLAPDAAEYPESTTWSRIDDVFFRARGSAWMLLQFINAARIDYAPDIAEHNAGPHLRTLISALEGAMQPLRTPAIMNGGGYGLFANHSLVLGSYLARAHAAVGDLRLQLGPP